MVFENFAVEQQSSFQGSAENEEARWFESRPSMRPSRPSYPSLPPPSEPPPSIGDPLADRWFR